MTDESSDWSSRRIPLAIALLSVIALGAAYFMYVRNQSSYYTARNLRMLARATQQINGAMAGQEQFVRNYALSGKPNELARTTDCGSPLADDAAFVASAKAAPGHELWRRTLIDREGTSYLRIDYAGFVDPVAPVKAGESPATFSSGAPASAGTSPASSAGTLPAEAGAPQRGTSPASSADTFPAEAGAPQRGCGQVALTDIFDPVLHRELLNPFELITLADAKGNVVYRTRPPRSISTLLRARTSDERSQNVPELIVTDLSKLQERRGFRDYGPLDVQKLSTSTRSSEVVLSDDNYLLFSQPSTFASPAQWIVGGFVSAKRFRYEIAAISGTAIIFAVALAVLAICCWPFLRIALMHERQPLTISDVVLTVVCAIIGAAVVTLIILDALAYRRISAESDSHLHEFATKLTDSFASDVTRAAYALRSIEAITLNDNDWSTPEAEKRIIATLFNDHDVQRYPYLETFAWIDENGLQRFKATAGKTIPRVRVGDRAYFRDAIGEGTWRAPSRLAQDGPYGLEWVHSRTRNEIQAVFAKRTAVPALPVLALTTDIINISSAVPPPGVEFAIIDERGNVIYHSDQQRIGYENFLAECDHDRALLSAVLGRRETIVASKYWGDAMQMLVRPLDKTPWTLVVLRSKRLVHAVNVEAVLMTVLSLLINSTPYAIILLIILIAAPWYRAPSLWPDPMRSHDYSRLFGIYMLSLFAFSISIYSLMPQSLLPMLFLMPAQVLLSTYLLLHRRDRRPRVAAALVLWSIATLMLLFLILTAKIDRDADIGAPAWLTIALLVACMLLAAIVSLDFLVSRNVRGFSSLKKRAIDTRLIAALRTYIRYPFSYRICAMLLLILGTSIPTIGFFKIGSRVEHEMLVKFAQLRLAASAEERMNAVAHASPIEPADRAAHKTTVEALTRDAVDELPPGVCVWPPPPLMKSYRACADCGSPGEPLVPDWFAALVPQFSDDSVAMRQLYSSGSTDELWKWCRLPNRTLKLDRFVQLNRDTTLKLWGAPQQNEFIRVTAKIFAPRLFVEDVDVAEPIDAIVYALTCAILILGVVALFYWIVNFMATRILLIDVAEPLWLARLPLSPTIGDHIFLTRRERRADALTGHNFYDVSFEKMAKDDAWATKLEEIDVSVAGRNVRVLDFEFAINDAAMNLKKLDWMERLLALPDRTVIIVSTVSASYIDTTPVPDQIDATVYRQRWGAVLAHFVWITADQLEMRLGESERRTTEERELLQLRVSSPRLGQWLQDRFTLQKHDRHWLDEETAYNPVLGRLRKELDPHADRKQLIDEIGERAETYYAGLWASCSLDEKLLLYHLARNGLANGKDRRLVRRVIARALVRRDPNLELFSETFRLYVLRAGSAEELDRRTAGLGSAWDQIRVPMFIIIVTFLILLFGTQKDVLTVSTTLATGLTSGIPLVIKLVGMVTERRLETAERV